MAQIFHGAGRANSSLTLVTDGARRRKISCYETPVTWNLPDNPIKTYERNPLAAVVVQLRFHPILKIVELMPKFQDAIRGRFPAYAQIESQVVDLGPSGAMQFRSGFAHQFKAQHEATAVSLAEDSFSIEYKGHQSRTALLDDLRLVLEAMKLFVPVHSTRLGLRYINIIRRDQIATDLSKDVQWADLLSEKVYDVPGGIASQGPRTRYAIEVTAPREPGSMTLRYGLLDANLGGPGPVEHFRFDTDRFVEREVPLEDIEKLVAAFCDDIYLAFRWAAGPTLIEWMGKS